MTSAIGDIPGNWREALGPAASDEALRPIARFVETERQRGPVYPPAEEVFAALAATPLDSVRAVIIGQDPYHRAEWAHGLAFSVRAGITPPPSLRNIFAELDPDERPLDRRNGSLEPWAARGVLLLNSILTVAEGKPLSHRGQGWEGLTDQIVRLVSERQSTVVFLLWGNAARRNARFVDRSRHIVLDAAHPAPRSVAGFRGRAPFRVANAELERRGLPPIDWGLRQSSSSASVGGRTERGGR